ncbi:DMT family transporter [Alteromonas sp. CYL-A6]|uniref:DMT family transporter n=1 Tax=Alteromonas nitratireducens TaxID=3390813 RepID=UPI0034AB877C
MTNAVLFGICCLIWGSTWIAITFQVGHAPELVAVAWRFTLAAVTLGLYCLVRRLPMRLPLHIHIKMAAVGLALYTLDYTLLYVAQQHIVSALLALMSSCIIYFNVVLRRLWLKQPVRLEVVVGATLGTAGICCIFIPEFSKVRVDSALAIGLAIAMVSFLCAAIGNVISERILTSGTPVVQMNFYAMSYGIGFLYLAALIQGASFTLPTDVSFYLALGYLGIVGSVLAFGAYMKLVMQMGADKAAYVVLVYPIVALAISTFFEGYTWTVLSAVGVAIVLVGNAVAMGKLPIPGSRAHRASSVRG